MSILDLFLTEKRSAGTRAEYLRDLKRFFGGTLSDERIEAFLSLPRAAIAGRLTAYKGEQIAGGLAEATVARRLAAVKSLLKFAHRMDRCVTDGRGLVASERIQGYRDTRGPDVGQMKALLKLPDTSALLGKRDVAMLRLLCESGLRRAEVCHLDVEDFDPAGRLSILGKGQGTQKVEVRISAAATRAIERYREAARHSEGALFLNARGERLSPDGLYYVVRGYGERLGIKLRPHACRHGAITAALDLYQGDVRKVQRFSRHKQVATVLLYDDNRRELAKGVSEDLSGLLGG